MTDAEGEAVVAAERDQLIRVAFRMLGALAEAEDAVQEAFVRWYRLDPDEQRSIRNPAAWLTTVVTRVCLDTLGSAVRRREEYVGPWLPEPVPGDARLATGDDPAEREVLRESVSTAILRLMERMTPAERVAVVLHDVFGYSFVEVGEMVGRSAGAARELASSGRRHLRAREPQTVDRERHRETVAAFRAAAENGEMAELLELLDPRVVLTSDGGGLVRAALNPIRGSDKVARFLLGVRSRRPDVGLVHGETADGAAVLFVDAERVSAVLNFDVGEAGVSQVWIQWNPRKLRQWGPDPDVSPGCVVEEVTA